MLDLIAPVLTHIFNTAISTGVFPTSMQVAKVKVIYKHGERDNLGNYRPVSILPIFSKGLEKVINTRIQKFSQKHDLISEFQFGFRKGRSTETALLVQKDTILDNFENKLLTLGIYLDFSKAFDRVNHSILLQKLERYGFRGLSNKLIHSYLQGRYQYTELSQHASRLRRIECGVPQGSILGPILFLFYINDIIAIDRRCKFIIYADDCTVFFSGKDLAEILANANEFCFKLHDWCKKNSLTLNETKTKCILFRAPGMTVSVPDTVVLGPYTVSIEKSVKTLGVIFSQHMSWNDHVKKLQSKLSRTVGIINRNRHFLPATIKKQLYYALFNSSMTYCMLVWGNTTAANMHKITVLQKRAVRIIENVHFLEHTAPLFQKNKIIKAKDMYDYKLICNYLSAVKGNLDMFLSLARLKQTPVTYPFRHRSLWEVPFSRTNYGKERLQDTLPRMLNYLHSKEVDLLTLPHKNLAEMFI